jgi:formylglycine-generating enzyme required for sulfatase activity
VSQNINRSILVFLVFASITGCARKPIAIYSLQPNGYVYVPQGSVSIQVSTLKDSGFAISNKKIKNKAFYISDEEVTNKQYKRFLQSLLDSGKMELFKIAYPDTSFYRSILYDQYSPQVDINYTRAIPLKDPYYDDFPVVNVSAAGVQLYCEWLTAVTKSKSEGFESLVFRIPSRSEWLFAALGGNAGPYPWAGNGIKNIRGNFLCNFRYVDQMEIKTYPGGFLGTLPKNGIKIPCYYDYTWLKKKYQYFIPGCMLKADAFYPNDYGLYNMVGNAAELVSDTLKIEKSGVKKDSLVYLVVGGSYNEPGYYMSLYINTQPIGGKDRLPMNLPSDYVGFRPVATYIQSFEVPRTKENIRKYRKAKKNLKKSIGA